MTKQRLELTWYNKDMALIPTEVGKYGYTWVDPSDPRYCETHTLVMDEYVQGKQTPKSDGFEYSERADLTPQDDNLLILGESGDVLEALTRVPELADKYVGKVKLIYIDPPFNTGEAFSHYEDNLEHSVWLTMMRDRLLHLRKLLTKDGSIWVHLDDVQVHRMRVLLDEVFGASNYVVSIEWEKAYAPSNNASGIPMVTDTILVYQASSEFSRNKLPRSAEMDSRYANPDGSQRGRWKQGDKSARHNLGKRQHPGVYGIQHPITGQMEYPAVSSNWRFEQPEMLRIMREWGPYELGEVTSAELSARTEVEGPSVELRDDVMPLVIPAGIRTWPAVRWSAIAAVIGRSTTPPQTGVEHYSEKSTSAMLRAECLRICSLIQKSAIATQRRKRSRLYFRGWLRFLLRSLRGSLNASFISVPTRVKSCWMCLRVQGRRLRWHKRWGVVG